MKYYDKHLIKKYNKVNNYIVISEFPSKKELKHDTGLSRYSQNTIFSLKKNIANGNRRAIVLANIITKEEIYEYENMLVIRCFKRNNLISFLKLILYAAKLNRVETVLFEFEFATYGNIKVSITIPPILFIFRLLGKKTYFALHQVVSDLKSLSKHLNLSENSRLLFILEKGLHGFYVITGILANKIIVLEGEFKSRLSLFVNPNKIIVIPHGIEQPKLNSTKISKDSMGYLQNDFIILAFGYVAWYKGLDDLIKAFNKLPQKIHGKNLKLIIAGGKSVAQKDRPHYKRYFNKITSLAKTNGRIKLTGFVPDEDIEKYYNVADLCVFPYKTFISSSGPLSLGITFQKPIVLSNNLSGYLRSEDFASCLAESKLSRNDIFIKINSEELEKVINNVIANPEYKTRMQSFTTLLLKKRNWSELIKNYSAVLFSNQESYRQSIFSLIKLRLDFI
ncbi:MAG: glycosyltransferase [Patescibacteria group bacterium]|nr:glycosyltransferase [Patescibacteria group bacterium]